MAAFQYPNRTGRRHGPKGYANYSSYRPWLRDEFAFRCVYCLKREQWGLVTGEFDLDHFIPQTQDPSLVTDYDNLLYACTRCNLIKQAMVVPDPIQILNSSSVRVLPDGNLQALSPDAESIILKLDLNSPQAVEWRQTWMRIAELASEHDEVLYHRILGFPTALPNLSRLRPPEGNTRPDGIKQSSHALKQIGRLPQIY